MRTANFWGQLIRDLREERGWSEYRLCDEAGISRPTLRKMEAGGSVNIGTLESLLSAFGYELEAMRREGR